jgi:uncharacterized membrane protein YesL
MEIRCIVYFTGGDFLEGLWTVFNWVVRLAYINVLWILFSIAGCIFLGIGPATVSVFFVIRKLLEDEYEFSIWKYFIETYKKEFWPANKLILVVFSICCIIYVDFIFLQMLPSSFFIDKVVFTGMIILSLLVIIWFSYLFAVYVHFELIFISNFKYAVMIAGIHPLQSILMLFGLFAFTILLFIIPAMSIFYVISVPILIIQLCTKQAFKKISRTSIS